MHLRADNDRDDSSDADSSGDDSDEEVVAAMAQHVEHLEQVEALNNHVEALNNQVEALRAASPCSQSAGNKHPRDEAAVDEEQRWKRVEIEELVVGMVRESKTVLDCIVPLLAMFSEAARKEVFCHVVALCDSEIAMSTNGTTQAEMLEKVATLDT